jgi:hypothetical protein
LRSWRAIRIFACSCSSIAIPSICHLKKLSKHRSGLLVASARYRFLVLGVRRNWLGFVVSSPIVTTPETLML